MGYMLPVLAVLGIGYLLGSIPFGLLLTRAAGLGDVRKIGSGSIGATNVLRTGNKALAAATLFLDGFKGYVAVFAATVIATKLVPLGSPVPTGRLVNDLGFLHAAPWLGGLGAFLGHIFPVWLKFKGGKGVATYIGVLIAASWPAAAVFCGVWLLTALITRYSSLSALVATLATFFLFMAKGGPFVTPAVSLLSALLFYKHHENIRRLVAGQEPKIGAKSETSRPV